MAERTPVEEAQRQSDIAHESLMRRFRMGMTNPVETEQVIAMECARGDAIKAAKVQEEDRRLREEGARLRAGR